MAKVNKISGPRPDEVVGDTVGKALGLQSSVTLMEGPKVNKQEKEILQGSTAREKEDLFPAILFDPTRSPGTVLVEPPFNLHALEHLAQLNNSLLSCVAAYEVNIDGTGWVIERDTPADVKKSPKKDEAVDGTTEFFKEVWPGQSFTIVRRMLRRDAEITGNAYMEIIRNAVGDIVYVRRLDPKSIRLVHLDDPVPVTKRVRRFGKWVDITMHMRERRFAQASANKIPFSTTQADADTGAKGSHPSNNVVYFKEFAASRDVNKWTGEWSEVGKTFPADQRGTELIHLTINEDVHTAYGVPRWINQTPSVIGSRKAEELNLDFFNSGGIPPIMIVIEGGELTTNVREQLQQYFWNPHASKHNGAIIEAHQTGGALDGTNNVRVKVERFGAEKQQDSMFEKYDEKSEQRIRSSFRLPPIFVGRTDDYSFATAFASYVVGEVQVFQPERSEFDDIINGTIIREFNEALLKPEEPQMKMRSLPLSTVDVQTQVRALNIGKGTADDKSFIENLNEKAGLSLKLGKPKAPVNITAPGSGNPDDPLNGQDPMPGRGKQSPDGEDGEGDTPNRPPRTGQPAAKVQKVDPIELIQLAEEWTVATTTAGTTAQSMLLLRDRVVTLSDSDRQLFDAYVARNLFGDNTFLPEDSAELLSAAGNIATKGNGATA